MDLSALYTHQTSSRRTHTIHTLARPTCLRKMSHTAFFYGTLMAPPVLYRVIWGQQTPPTPAHASLLKVQPAILHNHQRHKVKHADYPAILPIKSDRKPKVRGTLVQGLTDGDLWRLDIFEGSEYQRQKVKVRVLEQTTTSGQDMGDLQQREEDNVEGDEVDAETYIWIAGANRLESEEWDFTEFIRDKMKRWVGKDAAETDEGFQGNCLRVVCFLHRQWNSVYEADCQCRC